MSSQSKYKGSKLVLHYSCEPFQFFFSILQLFCYIHTTEKHDFTFKAEIGLLLGVRFSCNSAPVATM